MLVWSIATTVVTTVVAWAAPAAGELSGSRGRRSRWWNRASRLPRRWGAQLGEERGDVLDLDGIADFHLIEALDLRTGDKLDGVTRGILECDDARGVVDRLDLGRENDASRLSARQGLFGRGRGGHGLLGLLVLVATGHDSGEDRGGDDRGAGEVHWEAFRFP
jgi:hypothetical protein